MIRRCFVLTCVIAAIAVTLRAQTTVTLSGTIKDAKGTVVADARIRVTKTDQAFSTTTDASGRYILTLPATPGEWTVTVSRIGFAPVTQRVSIDPAGRVLDIRLTVLDLATEVRAIPGGKASAAGGTSSGSGARAGKTAAAGSSGGETRAAPPPPPPPSPLPQAKVLSAKAVATHATITVFFATDRAKTLSTQLPYGPLRQPDESLHLGQIDVHVPREHRPGYVERPTIWRLYREDPSKDFVVTRFEEQAAGTFFADLKATVTQSATKQAFIFVHGFNVAFDAAVYRTAQLAYDLDFDGAPILYSWPSEGTLTGYPVDQNNNDWTVSHLQQFLRQVSAQSGAQTIHLVAHSMGNRALTNALAGLARVEPASDRPHFDQLVLAAPDVDASIFRTLAQQFQPLVARATLYASSKDEALVASKKFAGYQRAGDTVPAVVIVPGMDTIDVTNVDTNLVGHFYYGDNQSVISDVKEVLEGLVAKARSLSLSTAAGGSYWIFRKAQ
jgi:esterase/lipase superfamily enzyme